MTLTPASCRAYTEGVKGVLAVLVLTVSVCARAEEAWPPPLPAPAARRADAGPPSRALEPKVASPGLDMLVDLGPAGLREEAARVRDWSRGREGLRLSGSNGLWRLRDASGAALDLSPAFGPALSRMNAYFGLTGPTLANPVTREELAVAFSAPAAVEDVARVFERSIEERMSAAGKLYLPELGGELTLDGALAFHFQDDPHRPTLREISAHADDPAALARIVAERPQDMARLDPQGILARHLEKRRQWDAEDRIPREKRDAILRLAVDTVMELAAGHYSGDFSTQLKTMVVDDWSGRYVGPWHCHPPNEGPDGWTDYYPPSDADYEAAAKKGQEIVVAFRPDGFDAYELSEDPGGAGFMNAKPFFSHSSEAWRARFRARFMETRRP